MPDHNEYVKAYHKANPARRRIYNREYYEKHKETILLRQRVCRAAKKAAETQMKHSPST